MEEENTKLIDRIGEQSSEKILNQSKQLYSVEQYLDDKYNKLLERTTSTDAVIYLESTRNMIRLIRSSNNTYLSDWAGVVSDKIREKINQQSNAQSQLFEDINLINYSTDEKRVKLEEQIEQNSQKLPSYLVPSSNLRGNYANIIDHVVTKNTDKIKQGKLKILLTEDSFKGHVVGKFSDEFQSPPTKSNSKLISSPNNNKNITVFARTGTTHDFHVGVKSYEFNVPLQNGVYEVEYSFELNEN